MPRQKKVKLIGLGLPANLLREFIELSYRGNTSIAPENYEIDAPLSDSRVKVYAKKGSNDKQVIIVHRGSVGKQDWFDNIDYFLRGNVKNTKSFKLHQERQRKAVEKYGGENIIGIGHSRGGLYLQQLQKDPATKLKEVLTYNKAVGFYDALRENPEEQTDVKVKNDFVSLLSGLQKRPNKMVEIDVTPNPLDFNKAHQPAELEKLGDTFIGKKEIEGAGINDMFAFTDAQKARLKKQREDASDAWDRLTFGKKTRAKLGEEVKKVLLEKAQDVKKDLLEKAQKELGLTDEPKTEELTGSGRAPTPKTLEQLKKMLKTLEAKLEKINKGKVYKTTNKDKVSYEISYTKARIKNHETKGEDLIITKKKKYKDELPAKAKPYKAKAVKPKKEVKPKEEPKSEPEPPKPEPEPPKPEPPKPKPPKLKKQKAFLLGYNEIRDEPKKEEPKKEEPKKESKPKKETKASLLKDLETIILTKDIDEIAEVLVTMNVPKLPKSREYIFDRLKQMSATKAKNSTPFNIKEFIRRINESCEGLMCKYGINSKAEFRKWIVKNHPDKGGTIDDAEFKKVLECAMKEKYCSKKDLKGGGFLWTTKEEKEERRAKRKANREAREAEEKAKQEKNKKELGDTLTKIASAFKGKIKLNAVDTAQKAVDTAPKAIESEQQGVDEGQQGIEEGEPMAGAGFYYLDAIAYPINPVYNYRNYGEIPSIIESEDEFLMGGSFTDMAGMNCDKTTGECFNPVWEKQKIKRQILSEYKIWYWPWGAPPAGHIRMAWLEPMIQERYQPLYEEFVKRRNVNIGLPPDASKDRFAQQMFSNLTDGLSYVPIFNTATSLGLSAASSLADTKKEDGS